MMIKTALVVLVVSVLSASEAFTVPKVCTIEDIGDGLKIQNCGDGNITLIGENGDLQETIVFTNDTLELVQLPDSDDCFIARDVHFPDGFSGNLEKSMEREEADAGLSAEMKALASECTGTIYDLVEATEDPETAVRRKRGCVYRYRLIIITRYFRINGVIVRRRYAFVIRQKIC